ncbi:MAG: cyclopropane fatty-acyl-phospholipid synthase-like methyltransferase [Alteromonadaceae bacterium]|jgi:cyclopropane fatty-acyl-phospholipid synthase-like methyltransferase
MLNFSPSCERNQAVILAELIAMLTTGQQVLEIGSLSGQHAIHFSKNIPHIKWQPSDLNENIPALNHNIANAFLNNCQPPIVLDVADKHQWPNIKYEAIFTANTLHIMSWQHVEKLFENMNKVCKIGTLLCVYGPFKYQGQYTSTSNENFQLWLQDRDVKSGIRDFEKVNELAVKQGFKLITDKDMPANNQWLIWQMA